MKYDSKELEVLNCVTSFGKPKKMHVWKKGEKIPSVKLVYATINFNGEIKPVVPYSTSIQVYDFCAFIEGV